MKAPTDYGWRSRPTIVSKETAAQHAGDGSGLSGAVLEPASALNDVTDAEKLCRRDHDSGLLADRLHFLLNPPNLLLL
jgi:hypothetical protein